MFPRYTSLPWFSYQRLLLLVAVLLLIILGVWEGWLEERLLAKRWGVVEPGMIFRSGQIHPALIESVLTDHGIEAVIDLQYWEEKPSLLAEQEVIGRLDLKSFRYPLNGNGTGEVAHYIKALSTLSKLRGEGKPVLVHCAAGSQRTGGVMALYRTLIQGLPAESAVSEMTDYDWDASSDQVLLDYLNENVREIAHGLVTEGVLQDPPAALPVFQNPLN